MITDVIFLLVGVGVGTLGTLMGAGGGFILVPFLLFLYPEYSPSLVTGISMLAVAANAWSGSVAYIFLKRVHWRSALLFTAASLPGAWVGVRLGEIIPRAQFEMFFGVLLLLVASFLSWRSIKNSRISGSREPSVRAYVGGSLISLGVGVLASFVGIGGGIIHVPLLSEVLGYPLHLATGTSHFILAVSASVTVLSHASAGHYAELPSFVPYLIVGIVVGAQAGARLSKKVPAQRILQLLALALGFVGFRLLFRSF